MTGAREQPRAQRVVAFAAGLCFSAGLIVGGMSRPAKVLAFLDVTGRWDPSLACVMAGAVGVHFIGWRWLRRRPSPLFSGRFWLPTRRDIDGRLVLGAAIFGVGWGLSGYCPGPAVVALPLGGAGPLVFVLAMLAGMFLASKIESTGRGQPARREPAGPAASDAGIATADG